MEIYVSRKDSKSCGYDTSSYKFVSGGLSGSGGSCDKKRRSGET
jgi:hypothetical protein